MDTPESILIVEDDELFLNTLVNLLQREGYQVKTAHNGEEAIELAKDKSFDLIVADIRLPGVMDGIDTVKKVKEIRSNAKTMVIFITGYADSKAPVRAIQVGIDDYIYKPFELEYFLHSVRRNLKIHKLEQQEKVYLEEIRKMNEELKEYNIRWGEKIREKTNELTLLFEIGRELTSSLKLEEVLATIVERMADVLGVEICSILLLDEKKEELSIAVAKGLPNDIVKQTRIKRGENISWWVLENKESLLVEDIEKDSRFAKRNDERYYTRSFISVPLVFRGVAIGVINVNNKRSRDSFNEDDLRLVEGIADQASIAIENARLYSNLQGVYLQIVTALTSIIELKDHYTKRHSERVTKYAVAIAEAMGLASSQIENIKLACQLHDLGKISIPENILTKPDKLTMEEWEEIKLHPLRGIEIIKPIFFLNEILTLIEQHHERYNGEGYPYGKKGEDIVLGARIMAVADSFDAMTTERPYAKALTFEEAIEEIKRHSGSQFDPQITEVFIKLLKEKSDFFKK